MSATDSEASPFVLTLNGGSSSIRFAPVFPTGIDRRDDLGLPNRIDIYYGMADSRIGVTRLDVPEHLPPGAPADGDGPKAGGQEGARQEIPGDPQSLHFRVESAL